MLNEQLNRCLTTIGFVCMLAVPAVASAQAPSIDSLALGRKWTTWLYQNQLDSLVAAYAPAAQSPNVRTELTRNLEQLQRRAGTELNVVSERFIKREGNTQYWRTAQFSNPSVGEPIMIRWAVNKEWQIIGLGVNPASAAPPVDKE